MAIADSLGTFVREFRLSKAQADIAERVRLAFLDTLGCIAFGSLSTSRNPVEEMAKDVSSPKTATIVGTGVRTWPPIAAFANGTMGHRLDFDDGISQACGLHIGVSVVPAVLAVGESIHASGNLALEAAIVGYEVGARVARAVKSRTVYLRGFHAQGVLVGFATTAACAHLLAMDEKQISSALSATACLSPVSPWAPFPLGGMSKDAYGGWPSMVGVLACYLAQRGFTSPNDIFEHRFGFYNIIADRYDPEEISEGLGERFVFPQTHYYKPYSMCRLAHNPVDCILSIARTHRVSPDQIKHIKVTTNDVVWSLLTGGPHPLNDIQARASIHYALAAAMIYGDLGVDSFSASAISNPQVRELAQKVEILVNPGLSSGYPRRPSEVLVVTNDGKCYSASADSERSLDRVGVIEKFRNLALRVYSAETVKKVQDLVLDIDRVSDVGSIAELLRK